MGGGGEIGGPSLFNFFCMEYGGTSKCQKMTWGGGVFKFLLSSIPTEQHDV